MLTLIAMTQMNSITAEEPKVVVIGAGLAGLTTAYRLKQKGFDVEVYEARNRVGGRIFTVKLGEIPAELGGQNVMDGGEPKATQALIEEFGLELSGGKFIWDSIEFQANGQSFDTATLLREKNYDPQQLKERLAGLAETASNLREVLDKLFEKTDPLYAALSVRLQAWEGGPPERLSTSCIGTLYEQMLGGISVTHPGREDNEARVDICSVKGGNSLLVQKLSEALGDRIHLNTPLSSVTKTAEGSYNLVFSDGKEAVADLLVLTLPCSVYENIAFGQNIIPDEMLDAIKKIEYGNVTRIVCPSLSIDKRKAIFTDSMLITPNPKLPYFTAYCVGETSRFDEKTVGQIFQQAQNILDFSGPAPSMAKDELLASYQGPVAHSWPNDPYVKGSYSYIAPGQEEILSAIKEINGVAVRTLFAPIDESLFFAGEHTTILLDGLGTIEAACESGERAAQLIENCALKLSSLGLTNDI